MPFISCGPSTKTPLLPSSTGAGRRSGLTSKKNSGVLDLCLGWNAIVLLDGMSRLFRTHYPAVLITSTEADIFMAKRSLHDVLRNELVSSESPSFPLIVPAKTTSLSPRARILPRHYVPHYQSRLYHRRCIPISHQHAASLPSPLLRLAPHHLV